VLEPAISAAIAPISRHCLAAAIALAWAAATGRAWATSLGRRPIAPASAAATGRLFPVFPIVPALVAATDQRFRVVLSVQESAAGIGPICRIDPAKEVAEFNVPTAPSIVRSSAAAIGPIGLIAPVAAATDRS
jgi:hypothetical protein